MTAHLFILPRKGSDGAVTKPVRFTKADVQRAIEGVKAAGLPVGGAKIEPDGSITILTQYGLPANDRRNPLDRLHGT